ncbi:MAG: hypothetical protein RLQ12_15235 [Cyclobacteriaceae bacterium]
MILLLNIFFGILLILAGVYLPYNIYKLYRGKIRYRTLLLNMTVDFGMIAVAIGFFFNYEYLIISNQ